MQLAAKSNRDQIIIKTVVPVGSAFLVAAFVAVAAWTGGSIYNPLGQKFRIVWGFNHDALIGWMIL